MRHADRVFDEVGVFADHGRHGPVFEVVLEIVFQVQGHGRAGGVLFRLGHGERVDAFGFPQVRLVLARLLRQHGHLVGGHERGVEPDAELSDELGRGRGIFLLRLLQFGEESARTGMCDGAEVFDELLLRHADAVVGDRQRAGGFVGGDADLALAGEFGTGQRQETPFVQRVGGVRDQLAQEDFPVRVDRVDHHVEQFFDFGFELHMSGHNSVSLLLNDQFSDSGSVISSCVSRPSRAWRRPTASCLSDCRGSR